MVATLAIPNAAQPSREQADRPEGTIMTSQQRLIVDYLDAFKPHGMVPILIPLGQEAGDVVDRLGEEFICRRADCFDNLTPREAPSSLPNLDLGTSAAAYFGLGISQVGEAELSAMGGNRVILRFDQVTVETVSQVALRQTLRPDACPDVARLLAKDPTSLADGIVLLGQVFRARRVMRLEKRREVKANFVLSGLQAIAEAFGLRLRAAAGGDLKSADIVELGTTKAVPVAFRPAFIRIHPGQPDTFRAINDPNSLGPTLSEYDPNRDTDVAALAAWMERQLLFLGS
jgi:hypothetical protein